MWKSKTRVTRSNLQVTSSNPPVRRLKARATRLNVRVARLKARVRRLKFRMFLIPRLHKQPHYMKLNNLIHSSPSSIFESPQEQTFYVLKRNPYF